MEADLGPVGAETDPQPAGPFSEWLDQTLKSQREKAGMDVPCGSCNACCKSSYFIHIAPDETETLSKIPKALKFPAPGLPKGHVVMGYNEKGHCPMLKSDQCSIYEHRPLTCRQYDCRVLAAAGLESGDDAEALLNQQIRRWKFSFPEARDQADFDAVQSAAVFLQSNAAAFPEGVVPKNAAQLAMLALKVHEDFLKPNNDFSTIENILAHIEKLEKDSLR